MVGTADLETRKENLGGVNGNAQIHQGRRRRGRKEIGRHFSRWAVFLFFSRSLSSCCLGHDSEAELKTSSTPERRKRRRFSDVVFFLLLLRHHRSAPVKTESARAPTRRRKEREISSGVIRQADRKSVSVCRTLSLCTFHFRFASKKIRTNHRPIESTSNLHLRSVLSDFVRHVSETHKVNGTRELFEDISK